MEECSNPKMVKRKVWEGPRVRSCVKIAGLVQAGASLLYLVGATVTVDASTARIAAQDSEWETPGFSLASTLQSLASVSQARNPAGSSTRELASKSAGVCGQGWRAEQEIVRKASLSKPPRTCAPNIPTMSLLCSLLISLIHPTLFPPTSTLYKWKNMFSVPLQFFHLLPFSQQSNLCTDGLKINSPKCKIEHMLGYMICVTCTVLRASSWVWAGH